MSTGIARRDFIRAAMAAPLLHACSSSTSTTPQVGNAPYDVVVVGAGAAGIGAGNALRASKARYVIVEANDAIGGRCRCDNTTFPGIAFDLGGQWFHQVTQVEGQPPGVTHNPLYNIAVKNGFKPTVDDNQRFLCRSGTTPVNLLDSEVLVTLGKVAVAIVLAGAAAKHDPKADKSMAQATASLSAEPYYDMVWGFLASFLGADLNTLSCYDLFTETSYAVAAPVTPSPDNFLIESGFGNFLATLARGLPIHVKTTVSSIDWSGSGVAVTTSSGTIRAKTAIVTVPLGTMTSGRVRFTPALPSEHQDALAGLPMRSIEKVALLFDRDVFETPRPNTFASPFVNVRSEVLTQTRAWGRNYCIMIVGGPDTPALERKNGLVGYALEQLRSMFPAIKGAKLIASRATNWVTDPLSVGSYSWALPGGGPGRVTLMQPVGNRVFFAGEAVSVLSHSTIHGAYISGEQAARKALAAV